MSDADGEGTGVRGRASTRTAHTGDLLRTVATLAKPAGLPVFPPHADPDGDCVLRRLLAADPGRADLAWPEGFEGGLAHRLDTSTSGAVAIARDPEELAWLRGLFSRHRLTKSYVLRASDRPGWAVARCDRAIAHHPRKRDRMVARGGPRTTHRGRWYAAETFFRRGDGDLVWAAMSTGVTHQIRLHAATVGAPLLGDTTYGGAPTPPDAPAGLTFYLHHLGFAGEDDDGTEVASAPVPPPAWGSP